jgi:small subunit ribosomal protein S4
MGRYIDAVCRLCRREGEKLFLKGTKCFTEKCPAAKRGYPPGQHGEGRRQKLSNYGLQLREKQKVRRMYGILERQFRKYFEIAAKTKGVTGKVLLQLLERRLDNVIFRLGIAISRAQARQIVRHNFIYVNSKRVNIPSFLLSKDDVIQIKTKDKAKNKIKENLEISKDRTVPAWLEFNSSELNAKILRLPEKEDIQQPIQEQLIVELYSKLL